MALLKCKMCGGGLNVANNITVVECEYCGSKQTIPNVDNEKKLSLCTRANKLRLNCEFDKAANVYESVIADFPQEAEAYWGLVLCNYGIEYVDDYGTGNKVPTCHRSSFNSLFDDENYKMACKYADTVRLDMYKEEAQCIEEIRKGIIEVSSKEKPYDIFICYKETDFDGERTMDSVLAQDVYDELTSKGYKVFFSRITLEDKLGTEYEPYIFAALNSAKLMLVFGTDSDFFNAVWVRNEWSRFLMLISKGEKKHIIPCFKGIDPEDMPKEFRKLQAQDLGKLGAMQDLMRGIDKIFGKDQQVQRVPLGQAMASGSKLQNKIKRGQLSLENEEWADAIKFFDEALNEEPTEGVAYWGKFLATIHVNDIGDIGDDVIDYPENLYKMAVKFANDKVKDEINEFNKIITYNRAVRKMQDSSELKSIEYAHKVLSGLGEYRDCKKQVSVCEDIICGIKYKKAIDIVNNVKDKTGSRLSMSYEDYLSECDKNIDNYKPILAAVDIMKEIEDYEDAVKQIKEFIRLYNDSLYYYYIYLIDKATMLDEIIDLDKSFDNHLTEGACTKLCELIEEKKKMINKTNFLVNVLEKEKPDKAVNMVKENKENKNLEEAARYRQYLINNSRDNSLAGVSNIFINVISLVCSIYLIVLVTLYGTSFFSDIGFNQEVISEWFRNGTIIVIAVIGFLLAVAFTVWDAGDFGNFIVWGCMMSIVGGFIFGLIFGAPYEIVTSEIISVDIIYILLAIFDAIMLISLIYRIIRNRYIRKKHYKYTEIKREFRECTKNVFNGVISSDNKYSKQYKEYIYNLAYRVIGNTIGE